MNYIIQIKYGQPFEHPILLDNFITAFPNIDVNNLPSNFAKFERVPKPEEGVYEELIGLSYQWDGDIVKDVWEFRQFTEQEKIDKQNFVKSKFAEYNSDLQSWVFDEVRCGFVSPVPYPNDGELYFWKESTLSWVHLSEDSVIAASLAGEPNSNLPKMQLIGADFITF